MSMIGSRDMETTFFHELKKKTSLFLKEKICTARLAFTDVTPTELLAEEATSGNPRAPDARTMHIISRAAFNVDDYWRIVDVLNKRLSRFESKQWRESYSSLILLEHLLIHGPQSFSDEFQAAGDVIRKVGKFQYKDEKGFDWGLSVRKKSERILKLLEKGPLLQEERNQAREVTRRIRVSGRLSSSGSGGTKDDREDNLDSGISTCNSKVNTDAEETLKEHTNSINRISQEESTPLQSGKEGSTVKVQKDHPFSYVERYTRESLLSGKT